MPNKPPLYQAFTACGKMPNKQPLYQGTTLACPERSATGAKSNGCRNCRKMTRALAPDALFRGRRDFFRKLFGRAIKTSEKWALAPEGWL